MEVKTQYTFVRTQVLNQCRFDCCRTLSHLRRTETDEPLLIHVSLAIEEINNIVRELFQGGDTKKPQKTIYVLDSPPDPF